ncbi:MAG: PKD domain-containing protein [Calditrichaeota bacterium]|nr:MAG: PKD domain-containing protein [Calditrichota bacterium]
MIKKVLTLIFVLSISVLVFAQIQENNFYVVSGKDSPLSRGDKNFRNVFKIEIPNSHSGKIFVRVFDADFGSNYDRSASPSKVTYRVFGKGAISEKLFSIEDALPRIQPLINLTLSEDVTYDNQWRTLGELKKVNGETTNGYSTFQLIVDGAEGNGNNLYQLYISSEPKNNKEIKNLKITTPCATIRPPLNIENVSQIKFEIPSSAKELTIFNFDADRVESLFFETNYRRKIALQSAGDAKTAETKITLLEEEKGKFGALVVTKNKKSAENVQLWVKDDSGKILPLSLPTLIAPYNNLPTPRIKVIPLSDCYSVTLDASGSQDTDNHSLDFEWKFEDGSIKTGSNIVHNFRKAGTFEVELTVNDNSGFVAHSKRKTKKIWVNEVPKANFTFDSVVSPNQIVNFNGSDSKDFDGRILSYSWDFGDGTKTEGKLAKHTYKFAGKFNVSLTVKDNGETLCRENTVTKEIWVNAPPTPLMDFQEIAAIGEKVNFDARKSLDNDGEISKFLWSFGDGTTQEGISVTKSYEKSGNYKVKLSVSDDANVGNSTRSIRKNIFVNEPPKATISAQTVISANENFVLKATQSADSDGEISDFFWTFGDGKSANGKSVTHSYKIPKTYNVKLKVTDNSNARNNTDETTLSVRVNSPPKANAGGNQITNESKVFFDGSKSYDSDDEIVRYFWQFGDGTSETGKKVEHVYKNSGTYKIKLTVTDASKTTTSKGIDEIEVKINTPPLADAGNSQVVSFGEKVEFDASFSQDSDGKITKFQWEVEQGVILSGDKVSYTYKKPGVYQVKLKITDDKGAEDFHYTNVTVNSKPIPVIANIPRVAPNEIVNFDGSLSEDKDGKIIAANWDFGDGNTGRRFKATHKFKESGRYNVTLTVTDNLNVENSSESVSKTVEVNYQPVANAGKDIFSCTQTVDFDASSSKDSDGDFLTYYWDFGDGNSAKGIKVSHTYSKTGTFPVTLTVDDGQGLSNSINKTSIKVKINSAPIAKIEAKKNVCAGESVIFDASKSDDDDKNLLKFSWDFGDGTKADGINPIHTFKKAGFYTVRLTAQDNSNLNCNSSFDEFLVQVTDAPVAEAGKDVTVCAGEVVKFDGSASKGGGRQIQSLDWDFGDGTTGGGISASHAFLNSGTYTVSLTITVPSEGDCENTSTDELIVKVQPSPVAFFEIPKEVCIGEKVSFDGTKVKSKIDDFLWDFGDGTTSTKSKIEHSFSRAGLFTVKLKVKSNANAGCNSSEIERQILVNSAPQARISAKDSEGRNYSSNFDVVVNSILEFDASKSSDSDGKISSYNWKFGDGKTGSGILVKHQFSKVGIYEVNLEVSDNSKTDCSKNSTKILVEVIEKAKNLEITSPQIACANSPISFEAEGGKSNSVYSWSFSDGDKKSGSKVSKAFAKAGKYQVQVISGGLNEVREIEVISLPQVILADEIFAEVGKIINIRPRVSESTKNLNFAWNAGDGKEFKTKNLDYSFTKAGTYFASLAVTHKQLSDCKTETYKVKITVEEPPKIVIQSPENIYTGGARDEVVFDAVLESNHKNLNYEWNFGDGTTALGKTVKHTFNRRGDFTVTVKAWNNLGSAKKYTFSKAVKVKRR